MKELDISRRGFIKVTCLAAGCSALGVSLVPTVRADETDFVGARQKSVYNTDAKVYKIRKSQDNPMIKKLYDQKSGFLHDGPCGHMSHHLLHTHYVDRSQMVEALKEKGFKLNI